MPARRRLSESYRLAIVAAAATLVGSFSQAGAALVAPLVPQFFSEAPSHSPLNKPTRIGPGIMQPVSPTPAPIAAGPRKEEAHVPTPPSEPDGIKIRTAAYGTGSENCPQQLLKEELRNRVSTLKTVDVTVDLPLCPLPNGGALANGQTKGFELEWSCVRGGLELAMPAIKKRDYDTFTLSCA